MTPVYKVNPHINTYLFILRFLRLISSTLLVWKIGYSTHWWQLRPTLSAGLKWVKMSAAGCREHFRRQPPKRKREGALIFSIIRLHFALFVFIPKAEIRLLCILIVKQKATPFICIHVCMCEQGIRTNTSAIMMGTTCDIRQRFYDRRGVRLGWIYILPSLSLCNAHDEISLCVIHKPDCQAITILWINVDALSFSQVFVDT